MTDDSRTPGTTDNASTDPTPETAALEAEIERTREDLAQTVDQLAARLDLKTRVHQRLMSVKDGATRQARRLRDRATDAQGRPTGASIGAGAVVAAVAVLVAVAVRRRHSAGPRGKRHR